MSGVAREMRAMSDEFAKTVSREMGKPIKEAEAEVEKCAWAAEHYAEHGERYLAPEPIDTGDGRRVAVHKRPLGVGPRDHAVELPALAGDAGGGADRLGGQHLRAQARLQRDRLRLCCWRRPSSGRAPRRASSRRSSSPAARRAS